MACRLKSTTLFGIVMMFEDWLFNTHWLSNDPRLNTFAFILTLCGIMSLFE
jgi:hypothetical protein